jgi:hypothetical protein
MPLRCRRTVTRIVRMTVRDVVFLEVGRSATLVVVAEDAVPDIRSRSRQVQNHRKGQCRHGKDWRRRKSTALAYSLAEWAVDLAIRRALRRRFFGFDDGITVTRSCRLAVEVGLRNERKPEK